MRFSGKKILVVGGAGFVGSNLCHQLLKEEVERIVVVDNLLSAEVSNLPNDSRLTFILGSIADDRILAKIESSFDYVFHLATYHGNQSSIHDPLADHDNNTITTLKLCEHFKDVDILQKIVYASAGCTVSKKTYDNALATNEDAEVSLYHDSPYQISKIIGELYGNYYWMKYQLPFVKARFQNVYGPREILGAGEWRGTPATVWRNVIPTFIWKALHEETLPLENDGIATRDFIYVNDIVEGLLLCALNGKTGDIYNLASGIETSIKDLAEKVNKLTGNVVPTESLQPRSWDRSGKRFGSTSKAEKSLGFKASTTLDEGLKKTIEWSNANKHLVLSNILKHAYFMPEVRNYR